MSNTTIAYSHKGGFWKTKYTFIAGWMARVGRLFYSGAKTPTTQAAWRHNSDTAKRTAYYIDPETTPIGSGISVSFNKNVSQNKIYKSFSIEGTSNINGANTFVVNSDSDDVKSGSMGRLTNKGGILYGHIGNSSVYLDGSNIRYVGKISSKAVRDPNSENSKYVYFYLQGAERLKTSIASRYVLYDGSTWYDLSGGATTIDKSKTFGNNGITIDKFVKTKGEVDLSVETSIDPIGGVEVRMTALSAADSANIASTITTKYNFTTPYLQLFEITPQEIDGAPPRGQYAQANIALGYNDYELFALNLNYEPTDLDHSK